MFPPSSFPCSFYCWACYMYGVALLSALVTSFPASCQDAVRVLGVRQRKTWNSSATDKTLVCHQQSSVGNTKHSTIWAARKKVNCHPARPSTTADILTDQYLLSCHCISIFDESYSRASFKTSKTFKIHFHSFDICLTHFHSSPSQLLFSLLYQFILV